MTLLVGDKMSRRKALAALVTMLICASVLLPVMTNHTSLAEKSNSSTDDPSQIEFNGQSFLNISGQILPNAPVNATWYAEVTLPESYGTELLGNRSLGLLSQIDLNLGNSDGWLDSTETDEFAEMISSARNWTNGESGGCCLFDYMPMIAMDGVDVTVSPPEVGPVNRTGGFWGWSETAEVSGSADARVLRLIDLPRTGSIIEEVPLEVSLPEGWEYKFSPMAEIIEGEPNRFTVNRSAAPVAHDIRITIGENLPPTISASRFPSTTTYVPLDKASSFSASCSDSPLETPTIEWSVSRGGDELDSYQNPWFDYMPSEIGISHGDHINVTATCTDFHGMSSEWTDSVFVDGTPPEWEGEILLVIGESQVTHDTSVDQIEIPSGGKIVLVVNGSDDSGIPVSLDLFTNITSDWRQQGVGQRTFEFTVYQGTGVNGADISIEDRHSAKELTLTSVVLRVMDDAGNEALREWIVRVLDSNAPTIIPEMRYNGIPLDSDDGIHEDDNIQVNLSQSFDDIDAIDSLIWSAWVDGAPTMSNVTWSEIESFDLPPLDRGQHEVVVRATDSSGNTRNETLQFQVLPKRGAHLSIVSQTISDGAMVGSEVTLSMVIENDGTEPAFVRACLDSICSRYEEIAGASLDLGPAQIPVDFTFQPENQTMSGLYIQWDSASSGTYGQIPIEFSIEDDEDPSDGSSSPMLLLLLVVTLAGAASLLYMRSNRGK